MRLEISKDNKNTDIFGKRKYRFVWGVTLIEFSFLLFIIIRFGENSSKIITKNLLYLFMYILSSYPLFNVINKLIKVIENKLPKKWVEKTIEKVIDNKN